MDSYDVVIIGTGAGGGTLARHLAPSGSGSCCSNAATGCRASWTTGSRRASSSRTATSRRTPGTTRRARRSSRRSTTSSAARRSSTARRSTASARRTSASSATTTASHLPGRSLTTSSSRTTRSRSSFTRCTAPEARTRRSRTRARLSVSGGLARAAHPAACRRSRRGRLSPVPRAVRNHAARGQHALQPLHSLRELRRLPMPGACEVGRRGAGRAARAGARERHAPDERARREARNGRSGDGGDQRHRRSRR